MYLRLILIALCVIGVLDTRYQAGHLPSQVASRFAGAGEAVGYMSRDQNLVFGLAAYGSMTLLFVLLPPLLRLLPNQLFNLPDKEHWLSEANRSKTLGWIEEQLAGLGIVLCTAFLYINRLVFEANRVSPPHIDPIALLIPILLTIVISVGWSIRLAHHFRPKRR